MNLLAELKSKQNTATKLGYEFHDSFEIITNNGEADCFIVATEYGFSPLGAASYFFSRDLQVSASDIRAIADWNRFNNEKISLIGIKSHNPSGKLKGIILAPGQTSRCYEQFVNIAGGIPYRDFYYNVSYESIAYAAGVLGAKKIAMSHLSASGEFHQDIATCTAEALAHYCDKPGNKEINSFIFAGCCIKLQHLSGIQRLNYEGNTTAHKDINTTITQKNGFDIINLDWIMK